MDFSSLNDQEIKALLMQYDSEMRKLNFQIQVIQSTIQKLHESLSPVITEPAAKETQPKNELSPVSTFKIIEYPKKRAPKIDLGLKMNNSLSQANGGENNEIKVLKKRGPKPKIKSEPTEPKKRGPKPKLRSTNYTDTKIKLSKRKYTKENPWPDFVIKTLMKYGHLMNSAQLYELAEEENNLKKYGLEIKGMRAMVSRAFHQLSNNKKEIIKFDIKGSKSYNYGLASWLNGDGKIDEAFLP